MNETKRILVLSLLAKTFAICRFSADEAIPDWATRGDFFSITRTTDEFSVVAEAQLSPEGSRSKDGWRALKAQGPFELSEVGVLDALMAPLAQARISVFTISTFDTDYLLLMKTQLPAAIEALRKAGHTVLDNESNS